VDPHAVRVQLPYTTLSRSSVGGLAEFVKVPSFSETFKSVNIQIGNLSRTFVRGLEWLDELFYVNYVSGPFVSIWVRVYLRRMWVEIANIGWVGELRLKGSRARFGSIFALSGSPATFRYTHSKGFNSAPELNTG